MRTIRPAFVLTSIFAFWLAASTAAQAQVNSPWSVSFDAGVQTAATGNAHGGATGRVLNLATSVTEKTYGDVYGPGFYWAAGVGYRVTENGEIRVQGSYTANGADRLQVGTVAGLQLNAAFADYKAFGMDFGYRQYYGSGRLRPFAGASAGFTRVSAIDATLTVPAASVTLADVPFYSDSTVASVGLSGGAQMRLNDRLAVQAVVDFRWHGDLTQNEGLAGTGLETINDESRRWALPISAGLTVRF